MKRWSQHKNLDHLGLSSIKQTLPNWRGSSSGQARGHPELEIVFVVYEREVAQCLLCTDKQTNKKALEKKIPEEIHD